MERGTLTKVGREGGKKVGRERVNEEGKEGGREGGMETRVREGGMEGGMEGGEREFKLHESLCKTFSIKIWLIFASEYLLIL